ncbi:S-layer homology domain-containing protein [Paenibacillus sp. MDMC362]|uniref:S-layer homology domain-containing protein n=1 Tax=Paenibacillus sp. MDMC362 TaxID=2977365 RepID=UPI000DC5AF94|nr:S-layer homology domain-containing protein [Paenibacillus sp. MDMC362]RAR38892.1 S-layer protein [Paenibacillus sp. MDMC362]
MYRLFRRRIALFLSLSLIVSLMVPVGSSAFADNEIPPVQSAGPEPVTLVSQGGESLEFTDINVAGDTVEGKNDYLALYTSGVAVTGSVYTDEVWVPTLHVAVSVDASGIVQNVVGPDGDPPTSWAPGTLLPIPAGGYVVVAGGTNGWDQSVFQKPLFNHNKTGDTVKLMRAGEEVTAADFLPEQPGPGPGPDPLPPELHLITPNDATVDIPVIEIAGFVANYAADQDLSVTVNGDETALTAEGMFRTNVYLEPGPNAAEVKLFKGDGELAVQTLNIVYEPIENQDYIEVEAAPKDITIDIEGPRKKLDYVDKDVTGVPNIVAIFTRDYGSSITIPQTNVAVQVDANNRVLRVINPSINGKPPVWTGPTELEIPEGGYVLMAQDNSYAGNNIKRYLAENFKVGDMIKLRKNGEVVQVRDIMSGNGLIARLTLDNQTMYTVTEGSTSITGRIDNIDDITTIKLLVNGNEVPFEADGTFTHNYTLTNGTNYIEVKVMKNDIEQDVRHLAVFARPDFSPEKEVILWVDQASNVRKFKTSEDVLAFLQKAKETGVTSVAFDVKGVEGYVSYKKNDLTGRPYVSEIKAPEKAGASPDLDLLQEFIDHGHALGLEIHAAINVFAEGSIAHNEYAVLNDHLDWEERVYFAENNGEIKRLRESKKQGLVAFVNPSNDEVRNYQLRTFEEIIKNYDVDGVVHDRSRYDNEGADFSDETRVKFEQFLQTRNKQLVNWPNDIFYYENNVRVYGPLIQDWWEFRSGTIQSFFGEVKALVDSYEVSTGRKIEVSSYVGSWYETYYLNGVNWGSKNFRFDPALGMPDESVYTPEYYQTGYIEYLDFLMIGAYQTTSQEIQKYITLGNIVTNGEIPLYAGIAMNNVQAPAVQREVFQAGLKSTNGLMLFDASQVNWPIAAAALQDKEWVKDYQLGMSLPGSPDSFLEGNFYNINRIEGNVNVMTEAFGYSTGTNRFGVEVVVDNTGHVTRVVNRNQAINWSWGAPEENNSVIPQGGFVISTLDPSGTRTLRQLVANAYNTGDQVRSAVLSGLMDDEGKETRDSQLALKGLVEVLGPGQAAVKVNGTAATLSAKGEFTANVPLQTGVNSITVDVFVDEFKTNSKTFEVIRTTTGDGGSDPGTPGGGSGSPGGGSPPPPPKPSEPERLSIKKETAPGGGTVIVADANEKRLLDDVARLSKLPAASRVLTYSVTDASDSVVLHLPVQGLSAAVKDLSGGSIVLESSQGRVEIPLNSLMEALQQRGTAESLQIRVGLASKEEEDRVKAALEAGASKLDASLSISLAWKQGDTLSALPALKGPYAKFTKALSRVVSPSQTTVLRMNPASGKLVFVPALIRTSNGKSQAEFKWRDSGVYSVVSHAKTFEDLSSHWAREDISLLASKQLIEGLSDTRFGPNEAITRAQFTAMLVRALGLKDQGDHASFQDVKANDWYAAAVATAVEHGLIEGFSNGTFRPNEEITREQMSVLLLRALKLAGTDLETGNTDSILEGFKDRERIASWSEEAVSAIVKSGLMEGRSSDRFVPEAHSTRAEGAVVLTRMLQMAEFINR